MIGKLELQLPKTLAELNKWEIMLMEHLAAHTAFKRLLARETMSTEALHEMLLQRRFYSICFTPIYDMAIDGLENQTAIEVSRTILREEYPRLDGKRPSHRENLAHDLQALGILRDQIMQTLPSSVTLETLRQSFLLLRRAETEPTLLYQIRLLTVLRYWGEVLVSVEYRQFWPRLSMEGLTNSGDEEMRSRFYYPHLTHDARRYGFGDPQLALSRTHSDRLATILQFLLGEAGTDGIAHCARIEHQIVSLKNTFYDQFT